MQKYNDERFGDFLVTDKGFGILRGRESYHGCVRERDFCNNTRTQDRVWAVTCEETWLFYEVSSTQNQKEIKELVLNMVGIPRDQCMHVGFKVDEHRRVRKRTTPNTILSVTYYLELRNAISSYHISHILTIIKLVPWTLQDLNNFTW